MGVPGTALPIEQPPGSVTNLLALVGFPSMDPNAFHLTVESALEPGVTAIVSAAAIERFLAAARAVRAFSGPLLAPGVRTLVSIALGVAACFWLRIDILGSLLSAQPVTPKGMALTGLLVASMTKLSERVFDPGPPDLARTADRTI